MLLQASFHSIPQPSNRPQHTLYPLPPSPLNIAPSIPILLTHSKSSQSSTPSPHITTHQLTPSFHLSPLFTHLPHASRSLDTDHDDNDLLRILRRPARRRHRRLLRRPRRAVSRNGARSSEPPMRDGAPDYTAATFARRHGRAREVQARLAAIDPHLLADRAAGRLPARARRDERLRLLRPRAAAVGARPGLLHDRLDGAERHAGARGADPSRPSSSCGHTRSRCRCRRASEAGRANCASIPPLLAQAQRQPDRQRARPVGRRHQARSSSRSPTSTRSRRRRAAAGAALKTAHRRGARGHRRDFVAWLEQQAPSKTGPSGIGKENYTWCLQNVHLVPMTWEDEVALLQARAGARAHVAASSRSSATAACRSCRPIATRRGIPAARQRGGHEVMTFLEKNDV